MRCRNGQHRVDSVIPLFPYEGAAAELVLRYKSGEHASLAPWFAREFARELKDRWPGATVVPVPPRPSKAGGRAWDQVEAIARSLARAGYPVLRCLHRCDSAQQKKLDRTARQYNSRLAYHMKEGIRVPPHAIIIDDVYTTGATVDTCAGLLKDAGGMTVHALVIAAD